MKTTWILTANRSGATLYAHTGPSALALVREVAHPEGHMKDRELGDDAPGRSYESGGTQRSSLGTDRSLSRDVAEAFARSLAAILTRGRTDRAFDQLVLMAEPRFLGALRGALDAHTTSTVIGSVAKDLPHPTEAEVRGHVRDLLLV